jgi:hypothetical protein
MTGAAVVCLFPSARATGIWPFVDPARFHGFYSPGTAFPGVFAATAESQVAQSMERPG